MGKQKQQRRSAKKKGGKKGDLEAALLAKITSVKCTACAQLVKPEDTISCPIPECDRVFCTERCSTSCLVQCADPLCLLPNRCRPCTSGKTLALLVRRGGETLELLLRRGEGEIESTHFGYEICDVCPNTVCGKCIYKYSIECSKCHKQVCLDCIDSDRFVLNSCEGACNAVYCDQCDEGFDIATKRCTECTVEAQFLLAEGGKWKNDDAGQAKMCSDERKKIVNEMVLQYAEEIKQVMAILSMYTISAMDGYEEQLRLNSAHTTSEGGDVGAKTRKTMKLVSRIFRFSSSEAREATPERIRIILKKFADKHDQLRVEIKDIGVLIEQSKTSSAIFRHSDQLCRLSNERADLCRAIASSLAPDVATMLGAFHCIEKQVSGDVPVLKLREIHLDVMQDLYQKELCGYCLQPTPNGDSTKRCGGCSAIRYCSGTCQALSWPVHRHHCQCMSVARGGYNERLLEKKHEYIIRSNEMTMKELKRTLEKERIEQEKLEYQLLASGVELAHKEEKGTISLSVGTIVQVQARLWAGINKPGGVARITKVHPSDDGTKCNVHYVLGGQEKDVDAIFIAPHEDGQDVFKSRKKKVARKSQKAGICISHADESNDEGNGRNEACGIIASGTDFNGDQMK